MTIVGVFPVSEVRTGGHKRYVELTHQLVSRGHRVVHVCRPSMAEHLPGEAAAIIPDRLSGFTVPRWWRYRWWTRRGMRTLRAVVSGGARRPHHLPTPGTSPVVVLAFGETNYPAAEALGRGLGAPVVFALRSNFVDEFLQFGTVSRRRPGPMALHRAVQRWWKQRLERWLCAGSDRIVFQSSYDRDNVAARNPLIGDRSRVIPNSLRVSWLPAEMAGTFASPNRSGTAPSFSVVYVGHLNERKGTRSLMNAIAELVRRGVTHVHVDVVGFGTLEAWAREYVAAQGLQQWVTFHGRNDQPLSFMRRADLTVVPSLYDSFPNTVLESLFVGTPVIGSDAAGIAVMLEHRELLFPRGDAATLADRISAVASDPAAYNKVIACSEERRRAFDFDWAERWEQVFHEVAPHR